MDRTEVIRLLGVVSLADDRAVRTDEAEQQVQVELWATALRQVPYRFAVEAIGAHYAVSPYPVMPRDIADRWRRAVRDRIARHVELDANDDLPADDPAAYRRALAERRRQVCLGAAAPVEVRALTSGSGSRVPANEAFRAALDEVRRRNRERSADGPVPR